MSENSSAFDQKTIPVPKLDVNQTPLPIEQKVRPAYKPVRKKKHKPYTPAYTPDELDSLLNTRLQFDPDRTQPIPVLNIDKSKEKPIDGFKPTSKEEETELKTDEDGQDTQPFSQQPFELTQGFQDVIDDKNLEEAGESFEEALSSATEQSFIPRSLKDIVLLQFKMKRWVLEQKRKFDPSMRTLYPKSSKAWWNNSHIGPEGEHSSREEIENTLVGASGVWGYEIDLQEPIDVSSSEKMLSTLHTTTQALTYLRELQLSKLKILFQDTFSQKAKRTIQEYSMRGKKRFARNFDQLRNIDFNHRLDREGNKPLYDLPWLEIVSRAMNLKDIQLMFSKKTMRLEARSKEDLESIRIHFVNGYNKGVKDIWLSLPPPKKTEDLGINLKNRIRTCLAVQTEGDVGDKAVEHPLFEIEVVDSREEAEKQLDLVETSTQAPQAKIIFVINSEKQTIDTMYVLFPHLTADESHGRKIVLPLMEALHIIGKTNLRKLYTPKAISIRRSDPKEMRFQKKKKSTTTLDTVEAMVGYVSTQEERQLFTLAKRTGENSFTYAQMMATAQTLCEEGGSTYICAQSVNEGLQMTETPASPMQNLLKDFRNFSSFIEDTEGSTQSLSPEKLRQIIKEHTYGQYDKTKEIDLQTILYQFSEALNKQTQFVSKDLEKCKKGGGLLAMLETNIPFLSRFFLSKAASKMSDVLDAGISQISSVSNEIPEGNMSFLTALAKNVSNGIGILTNKVKTNAWSHITYRWRAERDDIQTLVQNTELVKDADTTILDAVKQETLRRTIALRKNFAILCFLAKLSENPDGFLQAQETPEFFNAFQLAWNSIQADSVKHTASTTL